MADSEKCGFFFSADKNNLLKERRNISFEEVVQAIEDGRVLDIIPHPDQIRYANQKIYVVEIRNYAFLIPYVRENEKIFLKTIFPSRKATAKYLRREN